MYCGVSAVKESASSDSIPPISKPGGKLPTEDASVLTIRQILKYSLSITLLIIVIIVIIIIAVIIVIVEMIIVFHCFSAVAWTT